MIKLNLPCLPPSLKLEQAVKLLRNFYRQPITKDGEKLIFAPFYFFTFLVYKTENNIVKEYKKLNVAFDAVDSNILFDVPLKGTLTEIDESTEYIELEPKVTLEEAERIAKIMVSHKYEVPMQNVECLRSSTVYWPFFEIHLTVPEKRTFKIDAFSAELIGEKPKAKISTLFAETINDLKKPSSWLYYFKELVKDLGRFIYKLLKNRNVQIVILVLVLLVLIFSILRG